ncbi:MAG: exo-alpha-sialidase [Candidatus Hydrogenedentes bacterium]|nr:exo-alpha-sialidase [Candidatus Hydrogenedentota bacterium]
MKTSIELKIYNWLFVENSEFCLKKLIFGLSFFLFALAGASFPESFPEVRSVNPEIEIKKVFGEETSGGKYKHPASITQLENGDLYLAYYGGSGEYEDDTKVFGARLPKGEEKWIGPFVIADTPWRGEGNPVVWQGPDGILWLFYVVRYGDTWCTSRIHFKISKDNGETWSDSAVLTFEPGMMVRCKPLLLPGRRILLPAYRETGDDPEFTAPDTCSVFFIFDMNAKKWTQSNYVHSRLGNLQPSVVMLSDTHLLAYCRRGGGYDPIPDGFVVKTESFDGGKTWTDGVDTKFVNPNSAVDLLRLRNGHLLLFYNDSPAERSPLSIAISTDNGNTWNIKRDLVRGKDAYAYPYAIELQDGKIALVFTSHERTQINLAIFEEEKLFNWKE